MTKIQPWKVVREEILDRRGPFTLVSSVRQNPRNNYEMDFLLIGCADWAGVIPVTPDGRLVLVRQYRHGINEASLEIPAGVVDADDSDFSIAARRELREETGYDCEVLEPLGYVHPNPGMMPVRCHIFLARGVTPMHSQRLDEGEDIEVILLEPEKLRSEIEQGRITHSMVLSAFLLLGSRYPDFWKGAEFP